MKRRMGRWGVVCAVVLVLAVLMTTSALAAGWQKQGDGTWKYLDSTGGYLSGWQKIDGVWYLFTPSGVMTTGWQLDGKWYYLDPESGAMQTGWREVSGKQYYFDASGAMQTGWQLIGGKWYLFTPSGAMTTGWQLDGKWYYMEPSTGVMVTGWKEINGKWYYFDASGAKVTGWIQSSGKWYYLDKEDGFMRSGWVLDGGTWYFLRKDPYDSYMLSGVILRENSKFAILDASGALVMNYYVYNGIMLPIDGSGYIQEADARALLGDQYASFAAKAVSTSGNVVSAEVKYPYYIEVNKGAQIVTVYTYGADGRYTVPVKYMLCSTGKTLSSTPDGTYRISDQYRWRLMNGGVYSQYASRIVGGVLFHSIPCAVRDANTMFTNYYNQIGNRASAGCVRLLASEAKWIYDNCPPGTYVKIYTGSANKTLWNSLKPASLPSGRRMMDPSDPNGKNIAPPGSQVRNTPYPGVTPVPRP